ncbi:DUF5590 domain-containing protein [Xylocopilactobacillus apicola]|uniref:Cell wall elongation regulator TseB-like domain-containing protein n=1 Tax=Xylocopilactobacillus apicola TaxID=2932184 RepID=A0AAU9DIW3_9LACO|nr:DUF5590 domain-containing protein [Xylocopilactobacillus apicola]BDR58381.1 hypothetical protein XA3_08220 [Xylocopilactobacillus apicola]
MKKKSKRFPIIFSLIVIVVAVVAATILIANTPFMRVKNDALSVIKKKTDLRDFSKYYWYNHDASYFSALGKNNKDQEQYAIVNTSNGEILIVDRKDGISEDEAKKIVLRSSDKVKEIQNTRLGIYRKNVVWEVSFFDNRHQLNYYTLSFKNGKVLQKVLDV